MARKADEHRITQDDVARQAGVTRSLVSYVLNNTGRSVAAETRERILQAIDELGYRPNKYAQGLMRGNTDSVAGRQIGIVLNTSEVLLRPYYSEIVAGVYAAAHENDYHIRFIRFFNDLKNPILFNELIHEEEICGLIALALDQSILTDEDERVFANVRERIRNIVCVEWRCEGLSSITFDRQGAAVTATAHLLEKGYAPIAYIGEQDDRIAGFTQAMIAAGVRDLDTLKIDFANDMKSGYEAIDRVASGGGLPRAIVAGSDEVAIGILRFLNSRGVSVPSRVAIASIDNIGMAEFTNPPLTTVNVQKGAMGRQAVNLVVSRHRTPAMNDDVVSLSLPAALMVRESS